MWGREQEEKDSMRFEGVARGLSVKITENSSFIGEIFEELDLLVGLLKILKGWGSYSRIRIPRCILYPESTTNPIPSGPVVCTRHCGGNR